MAGDRRVARELGQDLAGQLLAELDAPLVEAVDVPDHALDEDLVLVERDQRAQAVRRELLVEDRGGRAVAGEDLVGDELVQRLARQALLLQLGARLGLGLAEGQGLGLGEEVGEQLVLVVAERA